MRDFVNQKSKLIPPSGIRKFFDIVRTTEGAISLGVGEPDFVTPWKVRSAAITSLQRGYTQYTGNRGLPKLLELISQYLQARFGLVYDPAHILITVGGSEAIDLALRACVERGDEILIPDPAYVSYSPLVTLADGVAVPVECREEDEFKLTPVLLEKAITDKTKAIILTYPNNPTGAIMTKDELQAIANVIIKHDLLVITDEIYAELTYGKKHTSIASLPNMQERTVYISGLPYSFENSRILYRSILWSANSEAELNKWFSVNFNVEVHAYVKNGKYCVVNNTYEPQDTTVYRGDGSSFELHLDANEIRWYEI